MKDDDEKVPSAIDVLPVSDLSLNKLLFFLKMLAYQ